MLLRCSLLGACLLLGAGCRQILGFDDPVIADASAPVDDDGWRSGTRLKLMWNDYAGSREYTGTYDAVLEARCEPLPWTDGKRYCTPTPGGIQYKDPDCTQPLGVWVPGSGACTRPAPPYFARLESAACALEAPRSRLFRRGANVPRPAMYYVQNGTDRCTATPAPMNYEFYAVAEELSPADLVEMTPETVAMGRLQRQDDVGADGSRRPAAIHDAMLETACAIDAENRCGPTNSAPGVFLDALCTQALAAAPTACTPPRYGARARRPSCADPGLDYFTVGGAALSSNVYELNNGTCSAFAPKLPSTYYQLATPVSPATLARNVDEGPGAQVRAIHFTDGMATLRGGMHDVVNGVDCSGNTATMRCLPASAGVVTYFTDAACTLASDFASVYSGPASCGMPPLPSIALKTVQQQDPCTSGYEVYRLTERFTGTVYAMNGLGCVPVTTTNTMLFGLGKQLELTSFAPFTATIDP